MTDLYQTFKINLTSLLIDMKCYKGLITIFNYVNAATTSNVMVLDFQLDDLTDLPNSPQELERISYLNKIYKDALFVKGVTTVPVADKH